MDIMELFVHFLFGVALGGIVLMIIEEIRED